jgi:tRNA A-37 threonylcarbamoyl transferase component Bud32
VSYTVLGLLGRGGMAVVDLAVDEHGVEVARKRVALYGSADHIEQARQRLRREAEVLGALRHPGIVPLLAVEDDGTDVILIMPRMAGSLADRVIASGPLSPAEVTTIGRVLLEALATTHRQGIVHRDIKPANVLFDGFGQPALSDFGVAVAREFTVGLTMAGSVMGTPGFLAPEQARGEPASAASDVFSLGATLAYALTGQCPFGVGDPMALLARAAKGRVAPLPGNLPAGLRRALSSMMDPRGDRRPTAAAALGGLTGTNVNQPVAPRRSGWRKGRVAVALGAAGGVLALLSLVLAVTTRPSRHAGVAASPTPTTTPCVGLAYQPCGQAPAPGTDGTQCLPGRADFDGNPLNGCEAVSDYRPGTELRTGTAVLANLVPAGAVVTFPTHVNDNILDFCTGQFRVTLTAPPGVTEKVEIVRAGKVLASAVSQSLQPATASAGEPSCFHDNSGWLTVRVSAISGQSADDFRLTRNSSW